MRLSLTFETAFFIRIPEIKNYLAILVGFIF